ncbi:nucleolar protein 12 [Cucumis melo var. makuwa]|uniref:Nucleolar protein 12 n=2 Tax=Cucumis melo TaxID=3656 RepID=A0A5A7UHL8_CUCMM|nr:nucleolar protein 12 [Cucumis melo]KAA0053031.1 nucleolar protein 12 [Cucumis melo var. makuwa]TYK11486.1 nucleolar protein 12 [Cucumis melo var. makuwa]
MGKNKITDLKNPPDEIPTVATPFSVFDTLFGSAGVENPTVSIFSSDNPFRRKDSDSISPPLAENSRTKGKEKRVGIDLDSTEGVKTSSEIKKSKKKEKEKSRDRELDNVDDDGERGFESQGGLKDNRKKGTALGSETSEKSRGFDRSKLGENVKLMKERKKRKRDELEREYEAKKYGVSDVAEDEVEGSGGNVVGKKRKALDDPSEMLVTKEGFDDESKLLRTVFVGNLPLKVKKKALAKEFSQFGEIDSVRIRSVPIDIANSKKPRKGAIISKKLNEAADSSHAYVVFKTEESAQASLSHNMAVFAGNHIRVDRACPPHKKLKVGNGPIYDPKRTVFVGNLPFDVKDEELYQLFCGIDTMGSSVEAVRVIRDPKVNVGKGFAYVFFKTREAANSVVNNQKLELRGRTLRLFHAKTNPTSTPFKKRNRPPTEADHTPAKKNAVDSGLGTPDSSKRVTPKATNASYQGLRASKSGSQKKIHTKGSSTKWPKSHSNSKEKPIDHKKRKGPEKTSERKGKRPAVANRKAVANATKNGIATPKQAGLKRKSDSRSPGSSHRNKRVKKFR